MQVWNLFGLKSKQISKEEAMMLSKVTPVFGFNKMGVSVHLNYYLHIGQDKGAIPDY